MARRGKTSPAEDIMDLVAVLPWWVGVALALVSYLLLHSVASQQVVATAQPGLEFMQRLAALVPRPRLHLIRLVSA